jgi:glycosyltransferase involved in cell wall biosynthesis
VHAFKLYPQLSVAPVLAAHRAGIPVVQTALDYEFVSANQFDHDGSSRDRQETKFSYRRLNESLHLIRSRLHVPRLSRIVTCSRYMAAKYATHAIETEVAPNPVRPYDGPTRGWEDRNGAVFAARLHPTKGVLDVIRAAELVPDVTFTVVGRGPLEAEVRRAAERLPNLVPVGWLDLPALRELFAGARVVLTPSTWEEPGALVSLEAMATGTPLVSYQAGGLTEYVEDAKAGLVVRSKPDDLANAVRQVNETRDIWSSFSAGGVEAAATVHSPEVFVRRYEEIYEEVILQASRRASAVVTSS